jgi:hypothetical protein
VGLGVGEQLQHIVTVDDTRLEAEFFHKTGHVGQNVVQKALISRKEFSSRDAEKDRMIQCLIKFQKLFACEGFRFAEANS